MKALVQTAYGDPAQVLQLQDVASDKPGKGQIAIEMEAAVVHIADLNTITGQQGFRKTLPRTPGYEGVGRVVAVGEGVAEFKQGDRVFPPIGSGTYREHLVVDAERVMHAPEGDATQLALLSLNPATALMMLQDFARLEPGSWVIQNAANSAVGRIVIALAEELKLRVVNVVKSAPIVPELKELGAQVVLLDAPDLKDRTNAVTQQADIKLAFDAVGGEATARIAGCLGEDGIVVNYGAMSGEPCHMPTDLMSSRGIRLCGLNPGRQLARHTLADRKALFARLGEMLGSGRLKAKIAGTYPLDKAVDAFQHAARAGDKRFGKVVLQIKTAG